MSIPLSVIVVEDEPEILENLCIGLSSFQLNTRGASDSIALDRLLAEEPADIIVLDLGLPGEDGIEIARRLQRTQADLGIIMLTARGMVEDKIAGMQSGADNYFVKPVDISVLAAAIRSLGRRLAKLPTACPRWQLDEAASTLRTPNNVAIMLTAQECRFLSMMLARSGENVSKSAIFEQLGLPDEVSFYPRLEVLISRLRSKVAKADPAISLPIRARHNIGYIFLTES